MRDFFAHDAHRLPLIHANLMRKVRLNTAIPRVTEQACALIIGNAVGTVKEYVHQAGTIAGKSPPDIATRNMLRPVSGPERDHPYAIKRITAAAVALVQKLGKRAHGRIVGTYPAIDESFI